MNDIMFQNSIPRYSLDSNLNCNETNKNLSCKRQSAGHTSKQLDTSVSTIKNENPFDVHPTESQVEWDFFLKPGQKSQGAKGTDCFEIFASQDIERNFVEDGMRMALEDFRSHEVRREEILDCQEEDYMGDDMAQMAFDFLESAGEVQYELEQKIHSLNEELAYYKSFSHDLLIKEWKKLEQDREKLSVEVEAFRQQQETTREHIKTLDFSQLEHSRIQNEELQNRTKSTIEGLQQSEEKMNSIVRSFENSLGADKRTMPSRLRKRAIARVRSSVRVPNRKSIPKTSSYLTDKTSQVKTEALHN